MKTTILGVLTILGAVVGAAKAFLSGAPVDFPTVIAAITAGIGLIHAADQKKPE